MSLIPKDTFGQVVWAIACAVGAVATFGASGTENTEWLAGIGRVVLIVGGLVFVYFTIANLSAAVRSLRAKAAAKRGGWLSDLLTRASQDSDQPAREVPGREPPPETARLERHTIESLDSIAVDIARMIDHDAAAELWDRYERGERNVFTRKLYTMQGQGGAFEDIRRRYRSDREFMETVDRYIAEFERLLDEVSRDGRGQMVARTYLTSETGKVYTMLAQAADRFD